MLIGSDLFMDFSFLSSLDLLPSWKACESKPVQQNHTEKRERRKRRERADNSVNRKFLHRSVTQTVGLDSRASHAPAY